MKMVLWYYVLGDKIWCNYSLGLVILGVGGVGQEIIVAMQLILLAQLKVTQPATLMKLCSWFKRAIVGLTLCSLKNISPVLLNYCAHFGFL